mmetsp:Transcript_11543/g.30692  ORF Transcript_11543/g.30692 Transcript_11543/m.30692 type:complete len:2357 (-) Transcript_11543:153-7223(-)
MVDSPAGDTAFAEGEIGVELRSRWRVLEEAVFGVLYTLSKEKQSQKTIFAIFLVFVDFLQLLAFAFTPAFDWSIGNITVFQQVIDIASYFQLQNALQLAGYPAFIAGLALLSTLILFSIIVSLLVGHYFKTGNFKAVWPIRLSKLVISVFLSSFYISSLQIFLIPMDCFTIGRDFAVLESYPSVGCYDAVNLVMIFLSSIMIVLFFFAALLITLVQYDPSPSTSALLGCPDPRIEVRTFLAKTLLTILTVVLSSYGLVQAIALLVGSLLFVFFTLHSFPFYQRGMNALRAGLYSTLVWLGICSVLLQTIGEAQPEHRATITFTMVAGLLPACGAGVGLGFLRAHYIVSFATAAKWVHSKDAIEAARAKLPLSLMSRNDSTTLKVVRKLVKEGGTGVMDDSHFREDNLEALVILREFSTPSSVEMATRFVRRDPLNTKRVSLAMLIFREGLRQFPRTAFVHLAYCNFLLAYTRNRDEAYTHLESARRSFPRFQDRFTIFMHDRQRMQQLQASASGTNAMDLVSFVDFRRKYTLAVKSHRTLLKTQLSLWKAVKGGALTHTFLSRSLSKIGKQAAKASENYASLLERYSKSPKVLRSYGKYVEEVRQDPLEAEQYFIEADRLEDLDARSRHVSFLETLLETHKMDQSIPRFPSKSDPALLASFSELREERDVICVVSVEGRVEYVNDVFVRLFGHRRVEVIGQSISVFLPPDISGVGQGFVKTLAMDDKYAGKIANLFALHRDGHAFPIMIAMNKYDTGSATKVFLTAHAIARPSLSGTVFVDEEMNIRYVEKSLLDMLGKRVEEMTFKSCDCMLSASTMGIIEAKVEGMKSEASQRVGGKEKEKGETCDLSTLEGLPFPAMIVPPSEQGGRDSLGADTCLLAMASLSRSGRSSALYRLSFKSPPSGTGIACVNRSGRVFHASPSLSQALGVGMTAEPLLGQPLWSLTSIPDGLVFRNAFAKHSCFLMGRSALGTASHRALSVRMRHLDGYFVPCVFELWTAMNDLGSAEHMTLFSFQPQHHGGSVDPKLTISHTLEDTVKPVSGSDAACSAFLGRSKAALSGPAMVSCIRAKLGIPLSRGQVGVPESAMGQMGMMRTMGIPMPGTPVDPLAGMMQSGYSTPTWAVPTADSEHMSMTPDASAGLRGVPYLQDATAPRLSDMRLDNHRPSSFITSDLCHDLLYLSSKREGTFVSTQLLIPSVVREVITTSSDGTIMHIPDDVCDLLGKPASEYVRHNIADVIDAVQKSSGRVNRRGSGVSSALSAPPGQSPFPKMLTLLEPVYANFYLNPTKVYGCFSNAEVCVRDKSWRSCMVSALLMKTAEGADEFRSLIEAEGDSDDDGGIITVDAARASLADVREGDDEGDCLVLWMLDFSTSFRGCVSITDKVISFDPIVEQSIADRMVEAFEQSDSEIAEVRFRGELSTEDIDEEGTVHNADDTKIGRKENVLQFDGVHRKGDSVLPQIEEGDSMISKSDGEERVQGGKGDLSTPAQSRSGDYKEDKRNFPNPRNDGVGIRRQQSESNEIQVPPARSMDSFQDETQSFDDQISLTSGVTVSRREAYRHANRIRKVHSLMAEFKLKAAAKALNLYFVSIVLCVIGVSFTVFLILQDRMSQYSAALDQLGYVGKTMADSCLACVYADALERKYRLMEGNSAWYPEFQGGPFTHLPVENITAVLRDNADSLRSAVVGFSGFAMSSANSDSDMYHRLFELDNYPIYLTNKATGEREVHVSPFYEYILSFVSHLESTVNYPTVEGMVNSSERVFLLDNWHNIRHGGKIVEVSAIETLRTSMTDAILTQSVLFGAEMVGLAVFLLVLSRLFIARLVRERRRVYLLFKNIPRTAVKEIIADMEVAMANQDEDDTSSGRDRDDTNPTLTNAKSDARMPSVGGGGRGSERNGAIGPSLKGVSSGVRAAHHIHEKVRARSIQQDGRARSSSVPDLVDGLKETLSRRSRGPRKNQVAPAVSSGKVKSGDAAAFRQASTETESEEQQGNDTLLRGMGLSAKPPPAVVDEKASFGLAAYKYLVPFLFWAVVQMGFTVFFVSYLVTINPSLPRIVDASERVTTATELLALGGAYVEAGAEVIPNSDFGVLFLWGVPQDSDYNYTYHSDCGGSHEHDWAAVEEFERLLGVRMGLKPQHEDLCIHIVDGEVYQLNFSKPAVNMAYMESLQLELKAEIDRLVSLMDELKSGGESGVPATQRPDQSDLLFNGDTCLLSDTSKCPVEGDPFFASVTQGLNGLVEEYVRLFHYLARSTPPNSRENQERVYNAAMYYFDHVYDGLRRSLTLILQEIREGQTSMFEIQIAALTVSLLGLIVFQILIVLPFIRSVSDEADRSVMLLSALPTKVHIDHILKAASQQL